MTKEKLLQNLMESVFRKAEKESSKDSGGGLSSYLSTTLEDDFNVIIDKKTFNRYYEGYITKSIDKIEPQIDTLNALSKYLELKDFKEFEGKEVAKVFRRKLKMRLRISAVLSLILVAVLAFFVSQYYRKNCMLWVDDHYEKVRCSRLVMLDEVKVKSFKKITVCDTTTFFKKGKAIIWYDKSNNQLTYFTHPGIHPDNKKTLKPITKDIIAAHVKECK